jgi:hypothetical protein
MNMHGMVQEKQAFGSTSQNYYGTTFHSTDPGLVLTRTYCGTQREMGGKVTKMGYG